MRVIANSASSELPAPAEGCEGCREPGWWHQKESTGLERSGEGNASLPTQPFPARNQRVWRSAGEKVASSYMTLNCKLQLCAQVIVRSLVSHPCEAPDPDRSQLLGNPDLTGCCSIKVASRGSIPGIPKTVLFLGGEAIWAGDEDQPLPSKQRSKMVGAIWINSPFRIQTSAGCPQILIVTGLVANNVRKSNIIPPRPRSRLAFRNDVARIIPGSTSSIRTSRAHFVRRETSMKI
jgi:hypothetical protein